MKNLNSIFRCLPIFAVLFIWPNNSVFAGELIWPTDCIPGNNCTEIIGYPDIDEDGSAFNCYAPGYRGHEGTDINIAWTQMDSGMSVFAAASGEVLWVFDGKYDRCPDPNNPDCTAPPSDWFEAGECNGYRVCTESGNYCDTGTCCCFWCFDGGNVVVIKHSDIPGVFATRYDHLKKDSISVSPGDSVQQGQKIAEIGSSGNSTGPHLHFEVWGTGFYEPADPWAGPCGPNYDNSLWKNEPPYLSVEVPIITVKHFDHKNVIYWESNFEGGFWNVYRKENLHGEFNKLNDDLITDTKQFSEFVDKNIEGRKKYSYKVEYIGLSGKSAMFGSVRQE